MAVLNELEKNARVWGEKLSSWSRIVMECLKAKSNLKWKILIKKSQRWNEKDVGHLSRIK